MPPVLLWSYQHYTPVVDEHDSLDSAADYASHLSGQGLAAVVGAQVFTAPGEYEWVDRQALYRRADEMEAAAEAGRPAPPPVTHEVMIKPPRELNEGSRHPETPVVWDGCHSQEEAERVAAPLRVKYGADAIRVRPV